MALKLKQGYLLKNLSKLTDIQDQPIASSVRNKETLKTGFNQYKNNKFLNVIIKTVDL